MFEFIGWFQQYFLGALFLGLAFSIGLFLFYRWMVDFLESERLWLPIYLLEACTLPLLFLCWIFPIYHWIDYHWAGIDLTTRSGGGWLLLPIQNSALTIYRLALGREAVSPSDVAYLHQKAPHYLYNILLFVLFLWGIQRVFSLLIDILLDRIFEQKHQRKRFYRFAFLLFYLSFFAAGMLGIQLISLHLTSPARDIATVGGWAARIHSLMQGAIAINLTTLIVYIAHVTLRQYARHCCNKGQLLRYGLIKTLRVPLLILIGVSGLYIFLFTSGGGEQFVLDEALSGQWKFFLLSPFFWALFRMIQVLEDQLLEGNLSNQKLDRNFIQMGSRGVRFLLLLVVAYIYLFWIWPSDTTSGADSHGSGAAGGGVGLTLFLAFGGLIGRDMLANLLSGILIYVEDHFKAGDQVELIELQKKGFIEYIGLRTTAIRVLDKQLLIVPNSYLTFKGVVNVTRMSKRRIKTTLQIELQAVEFLEQIIQQIRVMLQIHPGIDQNELCMVHFIEPTPTALQVQIYAFTKTKDLKTYRNVHQDVLFKAVQIIHDHGAGLAIPQYRIQDSPHPMPPL